MGLRAGDHVLTGLLDRLGHKYGTDKASGSHNYLWLYEEHLSRFRDREITLLEMGVGNAASLCMWRDFFPLAKIIGFDIAEDRRQHHEGRIEIVIGDQQNEGDLDRLAYYYGQADIIVDDAGHQPEAQVLAYRKLMPTLSGGGIYILEDVGGGVTLDFLSDVAKKIICGDAEWPIDTITLYRETSITRMK